MRMRRFAAAPPFPFWNTGHQEGVKGDGAMDIRSLIQFLQIAKDGSYTKAAASLYLVQPTLSKTIQNMEQELGVRLFQKNGQQIELTDYGKRLVSLATPIVNQFQQIPGWLREVEELESGAVSVGVTPMLAGLYLVSCITEFCRSYPRIELKLYERATYEVKEAVLRCECDVGLCMLCAEVRNCNLLEIYPLFSKEVVVMIHKDSPLSRRRRVSMRDLCNEKFNFYASGHAIKDEIYLRCTEAGFTPKINFVSSNAVFLIRLSETGNGITILPRPFLTLHDCRNLRAVPFEPAFPWECCLITRRDRYQPFVVKRFMEHIIQEFAQLA